MFPFVSPVYDYLNDSLSMFLVLMLSGLLVRYCFYINRKEKVIYLFLLYGLVLITLMSAFTRPFDTIHNYASTWPDRYFYIQNMIMVLIVSGLCVSIDSIKRRKILLFLMVIYWGNSISSLLKYSGKIIMIQHAPLSLILQDRLETSNANNISFQRTS